MNKVTGTYTMTAWKETPLRELEPPQKCTSVVAPGNFTGPLVGEGQTFYVLNYITEKTGLFSGYTFFKGKISDKEGSFAEGSFVLADDGTFDTIAARTKWTIIEGSGTGDLFGITGHGGFSATEGLKVTFDLEYELSE